MLCLFHKCIRQTLIEYLIIDFFLYQYLVVGYIKIKRLIFLKIVIKIIVKHSMNPNNIHNISNIVLIIKEVLSEYYYNTFDSNEMLN